MVRREKANYTIQSVSHALDVLEQFAGDSDELGVTELSKRLKLHKNNVFRLLATLEARGYIEQNKATENYRLGVRCLRLGQRFLRQSGLLRQARPIMEDLARRCGETVFVCVRSQGAAVVLDAVEPDRAVRLVARVGEPLPLHCTAAGRSLLAFAHVGSARTGADGEDGGETEFGRFTAATRTKPAEVQEQLDLTVSRGYASETGEFREDVASIAVPVRDYTRAVVASLSLAGPTNRIDKAGELALATMLLQAGHGLSARLGLPAEPTD